MRTGHPVRTWRAVTLACLLIVSWSTAATAAAADGTAMRMRAIGRLAARELTCHARAARRGTLVEAECLARLDAWFTTAYGAPPARCDSNGVAAAMHVAVDQFVADIVWTLQQPSQPSVCAAAKLRLAARRALREGQCAARAAAAGVLVDPSCLAAAAAAFAGAFARAEQFTDCPTTGNAALFDAPFAVFGAATAAEVAGLNACPSAVTATVNGSAIELTWDTPAAAEGFSHVRVLRRLNIPPSGPHDPDGELLFAGQGGAASDALTALLPDVPEMSRVYTYAVFACTAAGVCEPRGAQVQLRPTLAQVLAAGGYVVHWRHASADVCGDHTDLGPAATTTAPGWWRTCNADCETTTARQLNSTGVSEATMIGNVFRLRGIVVGRVVSSEFCRNFTTAELMAFGPPIELSPAITYFVFDEANRCRDSYALLSQVPAPGTNTALIGHAGFTCPVLGDLVWAEGAIFKPDGNGNAAFVARVPADRWNSLP